ncbi:MAG: ribosome biogenesis GTPase Der [Cellvibrionaceae bacterium]|nr:ribosome biogenesis GTPase Der [Cellvibrionaceae bacterium]
MLPVIALVGRPNVGKSTLFNQLTRSRDALVANYAGLTRDRKYGEAQWEKRRFICIDTGGLGSEHAGVDDVMAEQSRQAIAEADLVLFVVDCREGLTAADTEIANYLRINHKKTLLVANKIDGSHHDIAIAPFFELGFTEMCATTATHGRGVRTLTEQAMRLLPEDAADGDALIAPDAGIKIAVVGRPNVGKSTLVNRLLGEERVVVYDLPGTTRDSIYIQYRRFDKPYTLIDTAGVRRRKNVKLSVEKFSIVKTLQAIDDANVVILLMDAQEGIVDQDLHLMGHVIDAGRALVVALNKWDGLQQDAKQHIKTELKRRLRFVDFADMHFISALHGTAVGHLYPSIHQAYQSATDKLSTHYLSNILQMAVTEHQPPMVRGHRIKLRYAHPGGHNPPIIVIHGNQTESIPNHYKRYLEKTFRRALQLHGTPVRLQFKSSDNPYGNKHLDTRQKTRHRQLALSAKAKSARRKK